MSHAQTKLSSEKLSLLSEETILNMLETGRKNLEKDGSLVPVLFIELSNGQSLMSPLQMPDNSATKYRMFQSIGQKIRAQEGAIKNELLIVETWFVNAQEAPDATKYMPSQHPSRQEAIVLMGRNAEKTRSALVIQSFTRDEHNAPIWAAPDITTSDEKSQGLVAQGLLDALFDN